MKAMKKLAYYSVFDLKVGDRVFDIESRKYGRISSIKETGPEWIEAFVTFDDDPEREINANKLHSAALVTE